MRCGICCVWDMNSCGGGTRVVRLKPDTTYDPEKHGRTNVQEAGDDERSRLAAVREECTSNSGQLTMTRQYNDDASAIIETHGST
jgi:hypothetical protein